MHKIICSILILLLCLLPFAAQALRLSQLTTLTSGVALPTDIMYVVVDPSGDEGDRQMSLGDLLLWMATQDITFSGTLTLPASTTLTTPNLDTPTITLADDSTLTLPTAAVDSGWSIGLLGFGPDGTGIFVNLDNYAAAGDLASYMPLSTFTAAGDVPVGSASGAVTVISKGSNNTFFGVNNAGTLGFHASFNPVLVSAPTSDDTYSGTVASFTAGENLAQWDVVYCKNKSGVHACYKYDANGTDKAYPPRAMAVAAINADASGTFLLNGIVRNDGWSQTTNQDEGKIVYADGTTAGAITLTKSTTTADMVAIVGYVVEQNVVYFNPSPILVEVP